MRSYRFFPCLFSCLALVAGCAGGSIDRINEARFHDGGGGQSCEVVARDGELIPASAPPYLGVAAREEPRLLWGKGYVIGPEDLLEITVFEVPELSKSVRVEGDGTINLPLLRDIKAKGKTAGVLQDEITELLEEKYLHDPQVSVFVKEYKSKKVFVVGAVNKPGSYPITKKVNTLIDFMSQAEGLTEEAGFTLFLIRAGASSDSTVYQISYQLKRGRGSAGMLAPPIVVDLHQLLERGDQSLNHYLQPGDIINIPPALPFFVTGEVQKPGQYSLTRDFTVLQVVHHAGGLTNMAWPRSVRIVRRDETGKKHRIHFNLSKLETGKAEDTFIQGGDLVVVPKNHFKAFMVGFIQFVGMVAGASFAI
ncbi:MAG: polysaccharide biosynthesis/export family protein [Candidatus Tritonobacter lacicola]|nr:polysaccharide biosynthesis/export family protein [Candidatus Tritonobacter lacicola]